LQQQQKTKDSNKSLINYFMKRQKIKMYSRQNKLKPNHKALFFTLS